MQLIATPNKNQTGPTWEMIDILTVVSGKRYIWATVHIDFFSDLDREAYEKLFRRGEEVSLEIEVRKDTEV